MTLIPRLRLGNYGNGIIGLKAALPGYDVNDLTQDNSGDARSFNSQWSNTAKIGLIGWVNATGNGTYSVPHGLGYPPHYHAHLYTQGSHTYAHDGWVAVIQDQRNRIYTDTNSSAIYFMVQNVNWCGPYSYVIWKVSL